MADEAKPPKWIEFVKIVAMPLATLIVGFLVNASLNSRQQQENNFRLFVETNARREDADTALRKDMFSSILAAFRERESKARSPEYLDEQILNLELLAYNFNESIDLSPLFAYLRRQLAGRRNTPWDDMRRRLEKVALEVNERQLMMVSDRGALVRVDAVLGGVDQPADLVFSGPAKVSFNGAHMNEAASRICLEHTDPRGERHNRQFKIEVIDHDADLREMNVRLFASRPLTPGDCRNPDLDLVANKEIDTRFAVGLFDFPMIDNTRLSNGERCAVVLTNMSMAGETAQFALAYFPGSRASLRDKPYYDEIVHQLLPELTSRKNRK